MVTSINLGKIYKESLGSSLKKLKIDTVSNPYTNRLGPLFDKYLGREGYRSIPDIPIEGRLLINELMLRRDLHDIESGVRLSLDFYASSCGLVASRLTNDLIENIRRKHC